jgi:hypothetical protein
MQNYEMSMERINDHLFMDNPLELKGIRMLQEKFNRDNDIELDVNVEKLYEKLTEHVRNQFPKITDQKGNTIWQEIRPSGSAIINLFDELKAEVYFKSISNRRQEKEEFKQLKEELDKEKILKNNAQNCAAEKQKLLDDEIEQKVKLKNQIDDLEKDKKSLKDMLLDKQRKIEELESGQEEKTKNGNYCFDKKMACQQK